MKPVIVTLSMQIQYEKYERLRGEELKIEIL